MISHELNINCQFIIRLCSDPPLSEEDIPSGLWLCHTCRTTQQMQKTNAKSRVNSIEQDLVQMEQISRPSTPDSSDVTLSAAKMRLMHKRSTSRVSSCSDLSTSTEREAKRLPPASSTPPLLPPPPPLPSTSAQKSNADNGINGVASNVKIGAKMNNGIVADDDATEEILSHNENAKNNGERQNDESSTNLRTSLDQLIYAASIMNPKQFELPREMNIYPKFPGDDKGNLVFFFFSRSAIRGSRK